MTGKDYFPTFAHCSNRLILPKMTENDCFPTFDYCSDRLILPKVTEHDDVPTLVPYFHRLKVTT